MSAQVGAIALSMFPSSEQAYQEEVEHSNAHLGTHFEFWPRERVRKHYKTDAYYHAVYNPVPFTVNPLALTLGMARLATAKGVQIYEGTRAGVLERVPAQPPLSQVRWRVPTMGADPLRDPTIPVMPHDKPALASVTANDVVLAGAAQLAHTERSVALATVTAITYAYTYTPAYLSHTSSPRSR